jgi:lipopolysaccharide transport system permease protein
LSEIELILISSIEYPSAIGDLRYDDDLSPRQMDQPVTHMSSGLDQLTEAAPVAANTARDSALPREPVIVIDARRTRTSLNLPELLAHRELLFFLTWRDVKVRYKQTLLGASWAILQPLLTMLIFTLLFSRFAGIRSDVPYPIFSYAGLLIWTFFANAVTNSGNSLVSSANLITKIYFPRMIIPTAAVAAGFVDLVLGFLPLILLMIYYRVPPRPSSLLILPLLAVTCIGALGVGMLFSALNVKYRDVRYAIPFIMQIWMFLSPVIYPQNMLPQKWQWLLMLNPLTGIIENFRVTLFGGSFQWGAFGISLGIASLTLIAAAYIFRRIETTFADVV